MQIKVMFMTDIVKDMVWFLYLLPSLTVARYGKFHWVCTGTWIRVILQFLLWHIEVQIDKKTQGNGNQRLD